MFTLKDLLMGRIKESQLTDELRLNASKLLEAVNNLFKDSGFTLLKLSSGYRSAAINASVGGAKRSLHMTCRALDIADPHGAIENWVNTQQDNLAALGLWQEHPDSTPGWVHLDIGVRAAKARPGCLLRQFKP